MCQHFFPQNCYVFYKHLNTNSAVINNFRWQVVYQTLSIFSLKLAITAPFSSTRTLKFKARPTNAFFATVNQIFSGSSKFPTTAERVVIKSLSMYNSDNGTVLGSSRKLEGAAEHLIDGSENRLCWLSFWFWIPHAIERRSKVDTPVLSYCQWLIDWGKRFCWLF